MLRGLRFLLWSLGISFFVWAYSDPRFRGAEGFLEGEFCLPFSVGVALVLLGCGVAGRFRQFTFWFTLALIGQAVALQMIEAGNSVRYQHYQFFPKLLTESHPILLIFLLVQTVLVVRGIKNRWSIIRDWLHHNFKLWQLVCIGFVFFLFSATVSQKISRYGVELLLASFIQAVNLGNVILAVWVLPEDILDKLNKTFEKLFCKYNKEDDSVKTIRIDRFAILAAIWIIILASMLNYFVYERHPHISDEIADYTHAKYVAEGVLTSPAPPVPEAFEVYLMQVDGDRWYPVAPVGWPAVLSVGILLGVPWLVNPVLAGLNAILIYLLFQLIFTRYIARVSLLLLCVSPWYVFLGMSFMTHMSVLAFALCAALAIEKARRSGKTIWGWVGGIAVGLMSLIRPLEGLIVACLLGFWSIGLGGKRLKTFAVTGLVIGSMIIGSVTLFYNHHYTGDPTVFPLNSYLAEKFSGSNALGFGPDRGLGWALDPFPGHGPIDALVNTSLNAFSVNIELFGWSIGSLFLVALLIFSGILKRSDYIMIAVIIAVYITYFFYYFSGGPDFGARYWFLMLVPFVALTVRGIETLETKLKKRTNNPGFADTRVTIGVLSLCFFTLVNYFPWRAIDKYHHYRGGRPDIRQLATEHDFGRSLVLIRGDSTDYASAWFYNPVNLGADVPIYAWDKNLSVRTQLLNAYPDRPVWIINGPSITNSKFNVIEGPISRQELVTKDRL
ncbi:MAG: glycosyltransferase family 39 protein [Planctomycetes bacterium]|nr:glycosyltransferase family 39 protein [Planctomycetota bacterium]